MKHWTDEEIERRERVKEALDVVGNLISDNYAQVIGGGYARVLAAEVRRLNEEIESWVEADKETTLRAMNAEAEVLRLTALVKEIGSELAWQEKHGRNCDCRECKI